MYERVSFGFYPYKDQNKMLGVMVNKRSALPSCYALPESTRRRVVAFCKLESTEYKIQLMNDFRIATNKKVLIMGAGELGSSLQKVLLTRQDIVAEMWDKDNSKTPDCRELSAALGDADFLFLCLPSWCYKEAVSVIVRSGLRPQTIVVSFAKGLIGEKGQTTFQFLKEQLPQDQSLVLVSGPMLAEELSQGLFGSALVASKDKESAELTMELFKGSNLRLAYSSDVQGVALIGVLKNIYAIGLGIANALNLGDNFRGWYAGRAIIEMSRIVSLLRGEEGTVFSEASIGDLIATGFSSYSQNHELGEQIVKGGTMMIHSEGLSSLPSLLNILGDRVEKFEILQKLERVIVKKEGPEDVFLEMRSN